ncbi:Bifunctional protein GlmU [Candidatus Methanoperedenaceae archaeon GB37]|nr:Bifunctional protein GlmU [Candidatus Methanoperedenaceae archaeon GB37]
MCGGEGTRLRPLTFERPKPMIPLLNKPSIVHLVEHLARQGIDEIVITLGYKGTTIQDALGDGRAYGVHIEYVHDKKKLGTAGSVKNAEEHLRDEPFLVVGGDHVMDLNLREMYRFHILGRAPVTIGLIPIEDPRDYGIVDMDVKNRIHRFREKPRLGEIFSNIASTGIYVCDPEILDRIPENEKYDFAKNLFPRMIEEDEEINGFLVRGKWTDIGNPAAYREAVRWMLANMESTTIIGSFNLRDARVIGPFEVRENVSMGENSALVGPTVIGRETKIMDSVLIGPYTTIGSGCVVEEGSRIFSADIFDNVHIGRNVAISGAIIDNETRVEDDCILETDTVIGPRCRIERGSTISSGARIWPELTIKAGEVVRGRRVNESYKTEMEGS